jgi:hypothetical protein
MQNNTEQKNQFTDVRKMVEIVKDACYEAQNNDRSEIPNILFRAEVKLAGLLSQQKTDLLTEEREFVERIKLEVDTVICDCGEPYKDSDLANLITERLAELKEK